MDKTLENAFFKIYAGHTVELLTQWLEYEYAIAKGETFSPFVKNMYLSTLSMIEHAVQKEKFLDLSIEDGKWQINCIIDEIEENLKSCDNDSAKERYLIYILKPFGRLSKYYRLDQYLLFMQESVRMMDETLKEGGNIQGEVKIILNKYEEVTYKYDLLVGIRQTGKLGVMESQMSDTEKMKLCITKLLIYFDTYAYELKRMLQVYGISLEALQERTGIYIHPINQTGEKHRNAIKENKRSSIKDSSQYECARASNTVILPDSLNTNRAQEYFAKAIALGYLEKTERGYKSKFASKSLLAYFLELAYCRNEQGKDNGKSFPETELNRLLNESRLGKARGQYLGNTGGKPKGHKDVDDIFNLRS